MEENYTATCAGGCGRFLSDDWFELWCPECYSRIMEAYQQPVQSEEPPIVKPKRRISASPLVFLMAVAIFFYLLI